MFVGASLGRMAIEGLFLQPFSGNSKVFGGEKNSWLQWEKADAFECFVGEFP